jgi:hypothetical protein
MLTSEKSQTQATVLLGIDQFAIDTIRQSKVRTIQDESKMSRDINSARFNLRIIVKKKLFNLRITRKRGLISASCEKQGQSQQGIRSQNHSQTQTHNLQNVQKHGLILNGGQKFKS